jgi:hypothetical protein
MRSVMENDKRRTTNLSNNNIQSCNCRTSQSATLYNRLRRTSANPWRVGSCSSRTKPRERENRKALAGARPAANVTQGERASWLLMDFSAVCACSCCSRRRRVGPGCVLAPAAYMQPQHCLLAWYANLLYY